MSPSENSFKNSPGKHKTGGAAAPRLPVILRRELASDNSNSLRDESQQY